MDSTERLTLVWPYTVWQMAFVPRPRHLGCEAPPHSAPRAATHSSSQPYTDRWHERLCWQAPRHFARRRAALGRLRLRSLPVRCNEWEGAFGASGHQLAGECAAPPEMSRTDNATDGHAVSGRLFLPAAVAHISAVPALLSRRTLWLRPICITLPCLRITDA